jgi:hypothetical protein
MSKRDNGQRARTEQGYQRELEGLRRSGQSDLCAYVRPPGAIPDIPPPEYLERQATSQTSMKEAIPKAERCKDCGYLLTASGHEVSCG